MLFKGGRLSATLWVDDSPNVTPPGVTTEFRVNVVLGDIMAVNGQSAKGVYIGRPVVIRLTPTPNSGQAIADTAHFLDIVLGIVGAIAEGRVFSLLGAGGVTGLNLYSLLVAVAGAILVLVLYHAIQRELHHEA